MVTYGLFLFIETTTTTRFVRLTSVHLNTVINTDTNNTFLLNKNILTYSCDLKLQLCNSNMLKQFVIINIICSDF